MKHTPGPWRTGPINYADVYGADAELVALIIKNNTVCANACLIAAAPELLEACKRALGRMYVHQSAATRDAVQLCAEAIAKAEGLDPGTVLASSPRTSAEATS